MEEAQKITILMAEYNCLKGEIADARKTLNQTITLLISLIPAVLGLVYSNQALVPRSMVFLIGGCAGLWLIATSFWTDLQIAAVARRLSAIERDINTRAGERLLTWESQERKVSSLARRKRS